jgi:hypothetical protein
MAQVAGGAKQHQCVGGFTHGRTHRQALVSM